MPHVASYYIRGSHEKKKKFWIRLEEPPNLFKKREEVAKQ